MKRLLILFMMICIMTAALAVGTTAAGAAVSTHTITFDVQGIGETPDPITVNDGDCYLYLRENGANNPTADGYVFHCWVTTLDFEQDEVAMSNTAAYLETPIHEDMTLYAVWYKLVDSVEVTVKSPVAGDTIGTDRYETEDYSFDYQSPHPDVQVISGGARVQESTWSGVGLNAAWLENADDFESTFYGTFEDGRAYGLWMILEPVFGYEFAGQLTITLNGEKLAGPVPADYNACVFATPIYCGEKPSSAEADSPAVNTGDQTPYGWPLALLILSAAAIILIRRNTIKKKSVH